MYNLVIFIFHNVWENPNPTDELIFFKMLIAPPTSNVAPPWGLGPQRQAPVIRRLISPSQVGVPIFFRRNHREVSFRNPKC